MAPFEAAVGKPVVRVDGRLKVTGRARYTAEWPVENVAYGVLVLTTIAKGRITSIDGTAAERLRGVLAVISHKNAPRLHSQEQKERPGVDPEFGEPLSPFQDSVVRYNGQPVAAVVADSLEVAAQAARLVRVHYQDQKPITKFDDASKRALPPMEADGTKERAKRSKDYRRGDPDSALRTADVRVDATYSIPAEHHNPMELHATTAIWEGPKLVLYDKTQWVDNVREQVALAFGMKTDDVRVLSPFVGGAFGSALRVWPHVLIAAMAAQHVRRPVKLVLTRAQEYTVPGYRPQCVQTVSLGAARDGRLTAIQHDGIGQTSSYEQYTESLLDASRLLYACPHVGTRYRLAAMNVNTPASMRAPGEASGQFALESALDELAESLQIDPLELRLRNHADIDPESGRPWSSKALKECYHQGADRFGWSRRTARPRALSSDRLLVGLGMATATWGTMRRPATVRIQIRADGTAIVSTASSDIGPGTYTVMTQIAADGLGLPMSKVVFQLGDSGLPQAPVQGGSMTVASVGSAVFDAAKAAVAKLAELAGRHPRSPLHGAAPDQIAVANERIFLKNDQSRGEAYAETLKRLGKESIDLVHESKVNEKQKKFSTRAHGAHFVEVHVDPDFGTVRVVRIVSRFAAGRIINPKTAESQAIGGIVGGIGMALFEETIWDQRNGAIVNANLADYHVPVNADIPRIDVAYVDEEDPHVNPIGAKGLAELSLVGVAPAVANAVYHATGRRIRDLPITPDKLL